MKCSGYSGCGENSSLSFINASRMKTKNWWPSYEVDIHLYVHTPACFLGNFLYWLTFILTSTVSLFTKRTTVQLSINTSGYVVMVIISL